MYYDHFIIKINCVHYYKMHEFGRKFLLKSVCCANTFTGNKEKYGHNIYIVFFFHTNEPKAIMAEGRMEKNII